MKSLLVVVVVCFFITPKDSFMMKKFSTLALVAIMASQVNVQAAVSTEAEQVAAIVAAGLEKGATLADVTEEVLSAAGDLSFMT